jgi:hypothetical protein
MGTVVYINLPLLDPSPLAAARVRHKSQSPTPCSLRARGGWVTLGFKIHDNSCGKWTTPIVSNSVPNKNIQELHVITWQCIIFTLNNGGWFQTLDGPRPVGLVAHG